MDTYTIVKFIHVVCALLWVGGGFTLMLSGLRAERSGDLEGSMRALQTTAWLGNVLMVPASMLTLVTGLVMCWFWVGFADLWVMIGLAGFAATFLIGILVFKPTSERAAALIAEGGMSPAVQALGRRIMRAARLDYAIMLVVVAAMVLKPTEQDGAILASMVIVLSLGALAALGEWGGKARASA